MLIKLANLAPQLTNLTTLSICRSPAEFAEDHIPGALNYPVLDDEERARIGTMYKQVSPFDAKRAGAALVSRNIGLHLDTHFSTMKKEWRPLVYCWRGESAAVRWRMY